MRYGWCCGSSEPRLVVRVLGDQVDEAGVVDRADAVGQLAGHAAGVDIGLQGIDLQPDQRIGQARGFGAGRSGCINGVFDQQQGMPGLGQTQAALQCVGLGVRFVDDVQHGNVYPRFAEYGEPTFEGVAPAFGRPGAGLVEE